MRSFSARFIPICLGVLLAPSVASAQDLKAKLVVELDRIENELRERRWHFNSLGEKKEMEKELDRLKRIFDRVVQHESDIATLECNGATIDPEGGPAHSTEASDTIGTLSMGAAIRPGTALPPPGGVTGRVSDTEAGPIVTVGNSALRFAFAREISDTEVQLISQIVRIEQRLANDDWHLNNKGEKRALEEERERLGSALRRVRNARC